MAFDPSSAKLVDSEPSGKFDPRSAKLFDPSSAQEVKQSLAEKVATAAQDLGASFESGAGSLVQLPGQLYGLATGDFSDTGALKAGRRLKEHAESLKSEELKGRERTRSAKIREAEKQGVYEAGKTAFVETVKDPSLLLNFVAEQLPNLLPGMAVGRGLGALGMTTGAVRGAVATGAVQQGTDVGAGSYVELQKELVKRGIPEAEASAQALGLARKVGAGAAVISLLAQKLPGLVGLEGQALEKLMAGAVSSSAKKGIVATTGRAAKAGLGETASEMIEEGGGKVAQNVAAQQVDPTRKLTDGLGETMGMAAVGGFTLGTTAGALQKTTPEEAAPRVEPTLEQPAPATAKPQPAAQPQPQANPQKDALVQAYIKEGMAPDDAALLADRDFAALTTPPNVAVEQAAQAQQAAVAAATTTGGPNVPSAQPTPAVAQPTTGQPSPEVSGGTTGGTTGRTTGTIGAGLDAAGSAVGSITGGEELPRTPVDALTPEIPTYDGAQKVLNEFAAPEKYMIMEVEGGFVIVPRPAQAAVPTTEARSAEEERLATLDELATEMAAIEAQTEPQAEATFDPASATPVSEEVIKEEEAPSVVETTEAEQTEAQRQEAPVADESAPAVTSAEEADAILADTEQTETDIKASIDEGKTAQEDKETKYEKSNAAKKLNNITKQQIALADKLILMISDLKRVSNFADKHTNYKNFEAIDVRYKAARDELNSLLDYFEDLSTKGTAAPHRAAKDYLKTLDTNLEEHIKGIKKRAEEGRKARTEDEAIKAREKAEPVSAEETKEAKEDRRVEKAAEVKQAAEFKSRLDAYIDEEDKVALAKHYGEKAYNQIAENKFIADINTVNDEGLGSVSPVVQDIIKSINPDVSRQIVDKSKTDLGSRADRLLAAFKSGLIPQRLRRNFPNPQFNKAKSLIRALDIITKDTTNNTTYDILVADYLLSPQNIKSISDITLSVLEDDDVKGLKEAGKEFKDARGMYVLAPNGEPHIYLRGESFGFEDQGVNTLTVLHEGLHGAGNQKINLVQLARKYKFTDKVSPDLIEAVEGLERLMERARGVYEAGSRDKELQGRLDSLAKGGAFEDVKEFFTYAMTTPSMQDFLQNEVKGEVTKTSGFSRFIELALKLLGINPDLHTGLKDLFVYSDVIIKEKVARQNVQEIAKLLSADKAKLYSKAKKQKNASQDVERKLDAAKRETELIEDMGSLMNVAKKPELWVDYIKLNLRNISAPAYKGLLQMMPTNVVIDTGTALGIGGLTDVNANVQKMHTYRIQELQKVQDVAVPWIKTSPDMQKKIADVMHYATDVQIDPDTTPNQDPNLDRRWNALDNDAKEIYRKVRDFYRNKYKLYRALLEQRVNDANLDPEERKQLMASIKVTYETGAKMEPYFPFMRYGEYWASVGSGANKEFHMFESAGLRDLFLERRVQELNRSGDKRTLKEMMEGEDIRAGNDVASLRTDTANESANLKQMFAVIDDMKSANDTEKSRLKDEIFQMHLLTLPEASFRKQFIHRKGTAGFSGDALRNFVEASSRIVNQISRVKYGPKINVAMSAANDSLQGNPDQAKLGMITRELELRLQEELAPEIKDDALDKVARTANKAAFIWLLSSAKSAVNQMFSIPFFTMPTLAKYHGWGATLKEMGRFAPIWREVGVTKTDKNGNVTFIPSVSVAHSKALKLNPVEQRAYQVMVDRGVADATRTYDLLLRKGKPSAEYDSKTGNIIKAMGTLFHTTERLSREVSYMAAFRLEMKKHGDFDRATEAAMHVVNEALFDYSAWNAPRAMRSAPARVVTQFMKFPLFTSIYLARNFRAMMKPMDGETRAGAFKAFSGTLIMSGLMAGTAGMPMYSATLGIIQALRNALRDDDEEVYLEEDNLEAWFRKVWLHDTFGDWTIAGQPLDQLIDTGLLDNITGFKFSDGASLNNLWGKDAPEASSWKDAYGQTITSFLGPAVGLGQSWAAGIDDINKGDTLKGIEKLLPAAVRGIATDIRYKTEGAVSPIGDPIKYPDEFTYAQLLMQALGYRTTGLAERMDELYLINRERKKILGERHSLIDALNRASTMERDSSFDEVDDKIDEFNMKYPQKDLRIDYEDKKRALERRREMLRKSERGYAPDKRFRDLDVFQERSAERIEKEVEQ